MSTSAANQGHHLDAVHGSDDPHIDHNTGHHDPHLAHHFDTPEQQFSTSKLGIWLFLATEILMFGGLFCAYAVYRYNHPEVYLWSHKALDAQWGMINTIVLLASSFTMAWGVRAAQLNQNGLLKLMLVLTFIGGVIFMVIKTVEYKSKWEHHLFPGYYNSLNAEFTPPQGQDPGKLRGETVYTVENHGKEGHGEGNLQDHDAPGPNQKPQGGEGHNGEGSESGAQTSTNVKTDTQSGRSTNSPHVEDNAPNPQANARPNVASGRNVDQPATSQPVKASDTYVEMGAVKHTDGNAGTPDASTILPPAFAPGGINADADIKQAHQYTTYAQMEPTDRAQLNTFFSIYFMMTGLHGIHVLVGMGLMAWLFVRASAGHFSSSYFTPVDLTGLYWHLVDLIWIFLFPLLYLIH